MKIFRILFFILSFSVLSCASALDETSLYQSVLQVRSYHYDELSGLYTLESLGSSVVLPNGKIITNAHVIFDEKNQSPYLAYEICRSIRFEEDPDCYTPARLESYDLDHDLALLVPEKKITLTPPLLTKTHKYSIWSPLIIYGYPGIGGSTITRTAWRIAWYDDPFYKIDGIIDHGNSWGGAFSLSWELLGIPSRMIVDNASLGYMIPTSTVRTFLEKKTSSYTRSDEPVPSDFRSFLRKKYSEITRKYLFRNTIVATKNLKAYGMRYVKNISLGGASSQVLTMFLDEKRKIQVVLMCGNVGWSRPDFPYWKEEMSPDSEIVASNRLRFTTVRDYIAKDQYSYMIFDKNSPCILAPLTPINPTKDSPLLVSLERFFDEWLSLHTWFSSLPFIASQFTLSYIPDSLIVAEYPTYTGERNTSFYFENSLKKWSTARWKEYTFDREKDFLSGLFLFSDIPEDAKSTDIALYMENNRAKNETLLTGALLSGEQYYFSYTLAETEEKWKRYTNPWVVIIVPEKDGKWKYIRLTWSEFDAWLDQSEIERIKKIIDSISLQK